MHVMANQTHIKTINCNTSFQMNNHDPHPAVLNLRKVHGARARRLQSYYHSSHVPPASTQKGWKTKNPQVSWPDMKQEEILTQSQ